MSQNPHAVSSKAELGSGDEPVTRHRWLALLLALISPPVSMLYLGRPWRALGYLGATHGVSVAVMALAMNGIIQYGYSAIWLPLLAIPVALKDAWRLAPTVRWSAPPWYARGSAVLGALALALAIPVGVRFALIEPYRIPSVAMEPTLRKGDQVLVDKLAYGWTEPFDDRRIARFAPPRRGDVAVFMEPSGERVPYVKRVVGVPGDVVEYADKQLTINGKALPLESVAAGPRSLGYPANDERELKREGEGDDARYIFHRRTPLVTGSGVDGDGACTNDGATLRCEVPDGQYFVMGDNRDNSRDSRYFGFVSEAAFIGRVTVIWASEDDPKRAGQAVR